MAGGLAIGGGGGGGQHKCLVCYDAAAFHLTCCDRYACSFCLREFVLNAHAAAGPICNDLAVGSIVPLTNPHTWPLGNDITRNAYAHTAHFPPWYYAEAVRKDGKVYLFYYHVQDLEEGRDPRVMEVIHLMCPAGGLSGPIHSGVYQTRRPFSEL